MACDVELTPSEMLLAAQVGAMRRVQDVRKGRRPVYGDPTGGPWQADVEGACGELAVAKYLNVYWSGSLGNLKMADVGRLQVRTTRHADGCLLLHDRDADEDAFILVTGDSGVYTIRGWIHGLDGKKESYLRDPHGGRECYFVPQVALNAMTKMRR